MEDKVLDIDHFVPGSDRAIDVNLSSTNKDEIFGLVDAGRSYKLCDVNKSKYTLYLRKGMVARLRKREKLQMFKKVSMN